MDKLREITEVKMSRVQNIIDRYAEVGIEATIKVESGRVYLVKNNIKINNYELNLPICFN